LQRSRRRCLLPHPLGLLDLAQARPLRPRCSRAGLRWSLTQPAHPVLNGYSAAKISRADIHIDWQGGYAPALSNLSEKLRCFIRPGRVKGALYFQGGAATGIQFGRSQVVARLYNKTLETKEKGNEGYAELLTARCGETFDPESDVWRLEFELKRE